MKHVYLQTYGCQMNERDSEEILGMLTAQGYAVVEREDEADVILLNTCSVRAHAEERAFGKMAMLQQRKRERPELVLGILGCMAKVQREEVFRRLPQVDLVAGPAEIYDLPALLARVAETRQGALGPAGARLLAIDRAVRPLEKRPAGDWRRGGVAAFVTIMEGCDKRCAYCIVPMTRGQEVSRPLAEVLEEVQQLARAGYTQVTLLGQNVNAYGKRFPDGSGYRGPAVRRQLVAERAPELVDFPVLLRQIDARAAIPRVRFTTSHPFDAHEELFRAMADCRSVCEALHLPVQSGSDRILKAMRRGYTVESYRAKVARLRELVPDVALSTDVIVGFPEETEADFEATAALMAEIEYDSAFVFKYSPRPGTEAAGWADAVPRAVKEARNQALLALQAGISRRKLERWIGREVEVLVEERNRRGQLAGHTRTNVNVVCDGPDSALGELVGVRVERATATTLIGKPVA
ncbi:MAG: tRNA (N6-isopentenyl adenosine(37)-C2)-methylthiotransferase MiaB [Candidatus Rokubacteria bacterium]|nr:tRNA (N6-isopentenyl adenosine(37)-C2)-methylthiotransferase MiaB [Candidatus Rokubacteria bacterium]